MNISNLATAMDKDGRAYNRMRSSSFLFVDWISTPAWIARANSSSLYSVFFAYRIFKQQNKISHCHRVDAQKKNETTKSSSTKRNTHLILAVHAPVDLARLDQVHDVLLDLRERPPERRAHARERDRRERLEVQHHRAVPDALREVVHVRREVDVREVPRLLSESRGAIRETDAK
jgi:hypothetical protein